jgi:hypothetical protein
MSDLLSILAVLALVAANAFFVIGEYTVVTARRAALGPRAEGGSVGARAALRLMDDPVRVDLDRAGRYHRDRDPARRPGRADGAEHPG